ncbi:MAG: hypothetical protein IJ313_00250 [Clostridia bacterium]|nr:hypothetical protein [Clostridia bacterium]
MHIRQKPPASLPAKTAILLYPENGAFHVHFCIDHNPKKLIQASGISGRLRQCDLFLLAPD